MTKKRGPKADHPKDPRTNKEIEFLYQNKRKDGTVKNYLFYDIQGRQITATSNIWKAIKKYSEYYTENRADNMVEIPEEAQLVPIGQYGARFLDEHVSKEWIIKAFQKILEDDRKLVVDVSGNPNYWDFENTPAKPPSLTCQEILDEYLSLPRKKPLNYDYKQRMKRHWVHFQKIIGKSWIREISFNDVKKYRKYIQSQAEQKEMSGEIKRKNMWINEHYQAVHDILSKTRKIQEYKADINNLLQHLDQCIQVDEGTVRAKAVTREQWDILYKHSQNNLFIRCGILLGLNCAMTWGDILELTLKNFDFSKNTYIGTRSKNDIQNCAILFPETVEAIQQYIHQCPINDKMGRIFYYKAVTQKTLMDDIIILFNDWKNQLKQSDSKKVSNITHKHLRKSLQTTAKKAKCHIEYIKLVMGRKLEGAEEYYTEKDALMTSEVIDAVHKFYMKI